MRVEKGWEERRRGGDRGREREAFQARPGPSSRLEGREEGMSARVEALQDRVVANFD